MLVIHTTRRMKQLRGMALSCYYKLSAKRTAQPDESKHRSAQQTVQSLKEPFRPHDKRPAATPGGNLCEDGSAKRPRTSSIREDTVIVLEDSETEEGGSRVEPQRPHDSRQRTQVDKGSERTGESGEVLDSKKILKLFRVDEKKLA